MVPRTVVISDKYVVKIENNATTTRFLGTRNRGLTASAAPFLRAVHTSGSGEVRQPQATPPGATLMRTAHWLVAPPIQGALPVRYAS